MMIMKNYLGIMTGILLIGMMLSCDSSDEENVDLGETKKPVNMLSEAKPIELTQEQKVFVNDNNQFTLNFLKTVNEAD